MNGHDFTREQNMEARMTLAVARRGLAAAIHDGSKHPNPWPMHGSGIFRWIERRESWMASSTVF